MRVFTVLCMCLIFFLFLKQKLTWRSGQTDRDMCAVKGKRRVRIKKNIHFTPFLFYVPLHGHRLQVMLAASQSALPCRVCFQEECHNFIKVLVPRNDDLVFICGTNGFNPMCRYYRVSIHCLGLPRHFEKVKACMLRCAQRHTHTQNLLLCECPSSNLGNTPFISISF